MNLCLVSPTELICIRYVFSEQKLSRELAKNKMCHECAKTNACISIPTEEGTIFLCSLECLTLVMKPPKHSNYEAERKKNIKYFASFLS